METKQKTEARTKCELCGKALKEPETDYSKTAVCDSYIKGQLQTAVVDNYDDNELEARYS